MMVVLSFFFTYLFRENIPDFPLFVLPALLVWRFFSVATTASLESIAGNKSLINKVYFPRWLLVLSSNLANLLGSSLEFLALFPLMVVFGAKVTPYIVIIPIILVLETLLVFGMSLLLSAVNVYYRDFGQVWDIFLQAAFYLSPIFYSQSIIPSQYQLAYSLSPTTRIIEAARSIIYYGSFPSGSDFLVILAASVILIGIGGLVFTRLERRFAEL
jgi:lipopolysaccharide transport system permease protein